MSRARQNATRADPSRPRRGRHRPWREQRSHLGRARPGACDGRRGMSRRRFDRVVAQLRGHLDGDAAADLAVEDLAARDGRPVISSRQRAWRRAGRGRSRSSWAAPACTRRAGRFAPLRRDDVGDAEQAELETVHGHARRVRALGPGGRLPAVGLLVQDVPLGGEAILRPEPLDVDQRALPLAVEQVLEGGDRQEIGLAVRHGLRPSRSSVRS